MSESWYPRTTLEIETNVFADGDADVSDSQNDSTDDLDSPSQINPSVNDNLKASVRKRMKWPNIKVVQPMTTLHQKTCEKWIRDYNVWADIKFILLW
jgi:hypothetical protein